MFKKLIAALPLLVCAAQSQAVEINLDLTDPESHEEAMMIKQCSWYRGCSETESPYYAMRYNYSSGDSALSVVASGWSYNWSGVIEPDYIGNWDPYGLGIEDAWTPEHSIDNNYGDYDMMLLEFDQEVSLSSITSGWRGSSNGYYSSSKNSELSTMAFTGEGVLKEDFAGKEWQDLLSAGWESAGDYRINSLNQATAVNTDTLTSKYWLVGAYNSSLGGTSGFTDGNDFFKISGIGVSVNPVPLPGSMLLFGLSLLGVGAYKRRAKIEA